MLKIVPLKDGPDIPLPALLLMVDLDLAGNKLSVEGERLVVAGPHNQKPDLSDEERAEIRKWKPHLMALVEYCKRTDIPPPEG